jgi:hypothetical protein
MRRQGKLQGVKKIYRLVHENTKQTPIEIKKKISMQSQQATLSP